MDIKRTAPSTTTTPPTALPTGQSSGAGSTPAPASRGNSLGELIGHPLPPGGSGRNAGLQPRKTLPPSALATTATEAERLARTLLPRLFNDTDKTAPSPAALEDLQDALDDLRAGCARAGAPDAVKPMMDALAQLGELPSYAAKAQTSEDRDAVVALLKMQVDSVIRAIGPDRDGAALISLYGHGNALDSAIDTLRTHAATKMLMNYGIDQEAATEQAKALVTQERSIADKRLKLQGLLAKGSGFTPPLGALRFDPALVRGLGSHNPTAIRDAGIKLDAVLAAQRDLAQSPAAETMRLALTALKADGGPLSHEDASYVQQRLAALDKQPLASSLSAADLARLKTGDMSAEEVANLMQALDARGLSGVEEVAHLLGAAGRTLDQVKQNRKRLDKLDEDYRRNVDVERGRVLAGGLLCQASGDATLDASSKSQVRAALTGPGAPLAPLARAEKNAAEPASRPKELSALGEQYRKLLRTEASAEADLLAARKSSRNGKGDPTRLRTLEQSLAQVRQQIQSVLTQRQQAMGPALATPLEDTLKAAALLTRPEILMVPAADEGPRKKFQTAVKKISQGMKVSVLRTPLTTLHAQKLDHRLHDWGLDTAAIAPEARHLLGDAIDTARLDQWVDGFAPTGAIKDRWNTDMAKLAQRLEIGGEKRFASASLARFAQEIDTMAPGTQLAWSLDKSGGVSIPVPLASVGVSGAWLQLSGERDRNHQILASRDAEGYRLTLRSGTGVRGGLDLTATLIGLGPSVGLQSVTSISGGKERLDGVVLRFPDTDAGRKDMKALLLRLEAEGAIEVKDLLGAEQVLPEEKRGNEVGLGTSLSMKATMPFASAAFSSSAAKDSLAATGLVGIGLAGGMRAERTTEANADKQVYEDKKTYTIRIPGLLSPALRATIQSGAGLESRLGLGTHLPDSAIAAPVPLYNGKMDLVEFACAENSKDVRENGLVTEASERSVRLTGPAALMSAAVSRLGGDEFQALTTHLQNSGDPAHGALRERIDALLTGAGPNEEMRVVWRIAPEAQEAANRLLEQARSASTGQGGYEPSKQSKALAGQLNRQAQALLADPASYRLHALEKVSVERSSEALGSLTDPSLNNVSLGVVSWGRKTEGTHERTSNSIEFDPALVNGALQAGKSEPAARA